MAREREREGGGTYHDKHHPGREGTPDDGHTDTVHTEADEDTALV